MTQCTFCLIHADKTIAPVLSTVCKLESTSKKRTESNIGRCPSLNPLLKQTGSPAASSVLPVRCSGDTINFPVGILATSEAEWSEDSEVTTFQLVSASWLTSRQVSKCHPCGVTSSNDQRVWPEVFLCTPAQPLADQKKCQWRNDDGRDQRWASTTQKVV